MYKEIIKYETLDGVLHNTPNQARLHVENTIHETLARVLEGVKAGSSATMLTRTDIIAITQNLYAARHDIKNALNMEHFGSDGQDEDAEL